MSTGSVPTSVGMSVIPQSSLYGIGCSELAANFASPRKTESPNLTVTNRTSSPAESVSMADQMGLASPDNASSSDAEVRLETLQNKLDELQLQTSMGKARDIQTQQQALAKKRAHDLKVKLEKAAKAKKAGKWGTIFGWLSAAAMTAAGLATLAAGGAGTPLLIGGITSLTVMTLQQTGAMKDCLDGLTSDLEKAGLSREAAAIIANVIIAAVIVAASWGAAAKLGLCAGLTLGTQMAGMLVSPDNLEAMGCSQKDAPWLSLGLSIALIAAGMASGGVAIKRGSEAAVDADAASNAAERATQKILAKIVDPENINAVRQRARLLMLGVSILQAGSTVGGGAVSIAAGNDQKDVMNVLADSKKVEAGLTLASQLFNDQKDRMQDILDRMQAMTGEVGDMLHQEATVNQRIVSA